MLADAGQVLQHGLGVAHRLQGLRQDHIVERAVGRILKVGIGIALDNRQPMRQRDMHAVRIQLYTPAIDVLLMHQIIQQFAVA